MPPLSFRNILPRHGLSISIGMLVLLGLYLSKLYNYLLFHSLVELFSVITFFLIFVLFWHSRHLLGNRYLALIGIAALFAGIIDLLHALAYKGMGIFPGNDANLPTQLWIALRYLVSLSFFVAPLLMKRTIGDRTILTFYAAFTAALLWSIFAGPFPACFVEGTGLTSFKIASEYIIAVIFCAALVLLIRNREVFDRRVFRWMAAAIISSVIAELCFTQYGNVYGQMNMIGHFFLLGSAGFIYRAVVVTGIAEPASILFRDLKLSEERIRESEERYRSLVESSPDAIAVHCEGRFVYINSAGLKLFGAADAGEIIDKPVLDLVHPDSRDAARERMRRSYEEKAFAPLQEVKLLRLEGSPLEAEAVSTPISYFCKPASQVVIRDITERRRSEKAIEHLASFPRLNPNPVIELDARGTITFLNSAATAVLSTTAPGRDASVFIPEELNERLGTLGRGSATEVLYREVKLGDRTFAENIYLSHALGVARIYAMDITARKQAELELLNAKEGLENNVRERTADLVKTIAVLHGEIQTRMTVENELLLLKEKLQNTLESIRDAFFTLDRDWRFTFVNTETTRLFRKERDQLIGRSIWELSPAEAGTVFQQRFEKVMKERVPVMFEAFSPLLGIWVEVRAYPLDEGLSVFIHDISGRKETERRIRVTNDLLKLFTRKASLKEYLDEGVELIRAWSGCRQVGVRIVDGSGCIPYVASEGFSTEFLASESMLLLGDDQCACTRVISQMPEVQDLPVMTQNGSFHSNNFKQYLAGLAQEQQSRFRGMCVRFGFASVGVIPIRYRDKVLGAIHLADEREGMLPPENMEFVELMAFIVGEAVYRFGIEEQLRRNFEDLRESERRYRNLVEGARDIIFTILPDGTMASFSPAFESITGFSTDEWIGRHFTSLLHPDDVGFADEIFSRIRRGEAVPLFELRGLTRSGEYRHFEFKITSTGLNGGVVLGIARDITERKQSEEERARLVSAVEAAAEAVVITSSATGTIQYVNPAFEQMTGYTREEAEGRTLHFLESGRHDEVYYAGLRERLSEEGVWSGKLINRKKDGTEYFEECTVSPVRNPKGKIINYVYVKRDVTERMRLQSIAEAVNTMNNIGYVFSGISHEIGNPVSSLSVNLEVMKEKLETDSREKIAPYIDRAMSQVSRIEYLLSSLRSFNMFEVQELRDVEIGPFLEQFLSLVREDFTQKGIAIEVETAVSAVARGDSRALQQVMLNIFTNAADALKNRPGPRIVIRTSRNAGLIRLRVEDNGCGMTREQQETLFKPFYTTKHHGTGLGMVITRNMLAKMGGTIEVESTKDGGTSIEITLPEGNHGK